MVFTEIMHKQKSLISDQIEEADTPQKSATVDAIVIGAGLGGLLSAAHLAQRGQRVAIIERLPHCGGRFTAKTFQGVQVSTGAVHMVPFGSSGVLSQMLQRLQVPYRFFDADVFGSFYVHGRQFQARGVPGVFAFLGFRQSLRLLQLAYGMFFRPLSVQEQEQPFDQWLKRQINVQRNPQLVAFFQSIARFALSVELSQVRVAEVIAITKNMLRYGAPAIVEGGCGQLTRQLERLVRQQGGTFYLHCEALQILQEEGRTTGVQVRSKSDGSAMTIQAPLVVSDVGPRATDALLQNRRITQAELLRQQKSLSSEEAVGLKVHLLSDISFIPHRGIMYCLDTQRIAGMVQPTNSDASLAPAGKHLLISHQVIQSNNIEEERALALADLRHLFGDAFEKHCRILTMGTYRGEWPVNRMAQGEDAHIQTTVQGLYLVGDAVKPSGYLMVEGVAQSVNCLLELLDRLDQASAGRRSPWRRRYVMAPPSRLKALRWLWKAPGNSGNR